MRDQMMQYGVTLAKRYTNKQKQFFVDYIKSIAEKKQWKTQQLKCKEGLLRSSHLIVQDIEQADYVLVVSYETLSKSILPNTVYYPLNGQKNIQVETKQLFYQTTISIVLFAFAFILYMCFNNVNGILKIITLIGIILFLLLAFICMQSKANHMNFNRNSASIALLTSFFEQEIHAKVAYVFLDKTANAYTGYRQLQEWIKPHQKVLIFDCIAHGQTLVWAHSKTVEGMWFEAKMTCRHKEYNETENTPLQFFKNGIVLTSGEVENGELVVRNTRTNKDMEVDIKRLEKIREVVIQFMEEKR